MAVGGRQGEEENLPDAENGPWKDAGEQGACQALGHGLSVGAQNCRGGNVR